MQPKKFSEYTPITETDGSEVIPILKAGVNATVKSEDLPISTATQTAIDAADADISAHVADVANPHQVTKTQVGLGNVDNTSDANKPVSTAQATAIALKADTTYVDSQDALKADQATTYTKTEVDARDTAVADTAQTNLTAHTSNTSNPHSTTKSQVGLGNADNTSDVDKPISTATQTALDAKATNTALAAHTDNTSNPHNVTKAQVGLGNADNTSDANKPVSTAQQTALNAKANASDTVNLTGNQTVAGVKTFSSSPVVPTATTGTQTINKSQMDTADALKVNKAGDTMTAPLTIQTATGSTSLFLKNTTASGKEYELYSDSSGRFGIWNKTNGIGPLRILADAGVESLIVQSNGIKISGSDYITGTGFPEGVITAPVGSIYIDKVITNGASSWIKKSGTGSTGWQVLEGDTGWRNITSLASTEIAVVNSNDYGYYVRRVNNQVQINIKAQTVTASWNGQAISVPDGFRVINASTPVAMGEALQTAGPGRGQIQIGPSLILVSSTWSASGIRFTYNLVTTTTNAWPATLPGTAV